MVRILDVDLDFFVHGAAHWKESTDDRLDANDFPPWTVDNAKEFLENRCLLTGRRPGFVVEHHGELFGRWLQAIEADGLEPPFQVTHVDAHADLGLGDAGYIYLLTELLFQPPEDRRSPRLGPEGLNDGNWLNFAIACRWISELTYVYNTDDERPNDLMTVVMEAFDADTHNIQLAGMERSDLNNMLHWDRDPPTVQHLEPKVPYSWYPWASFVASEPFDVVCLTRSPGFTPAASDALFEEIRHTFIDEILL